MYEMQWDVDKTTSERIVQVIYLLQFDKEGLNKAFEHYTIIYIVY
jgi:hypothetical protein